MPRWIVDYEYRYSQPDGVVVSDEAYSAIELIELHPAVWTARKAAELRAWVAANDDKSEPTWPRIDRIHSAIERGATPC